MNVGFNKPLGSSKNVQFIGQPNAETASIAYDGTLLPAGTQIKLGEIL